MIIYIMQFEDLHIDAPVIVIILFSCTNIWLY